VQKGKVEASSLKAYALSRKRLPTNKSSGTNVREPL
jgi:hypothetical protein